MRPISRRPERVLCAVDERGHRRVKLWAPLSTLVGHIALGKQGKSVSIASDQRLKRGSLFLVPLAHSQPPRVCDGS